MIKAKNAVLRVKRINGRNGQFCIADLATDFGKFKVKEPFLDQFEEGEYQVTAWISEIFLGQYVSYGKAVSEIRAHLHDLQVITEDQRPVPEEATEIDPLDEPGAAPVVAPEPPAASEEITLARPAGGKAPDTRWDKFKKKPAKREEEVVAPEAGSDDSLYDEETLAAIERREPIKLDASVHRAKLRDQTAGLKERGYRFNSREQTWFPG